MATTLFVRHKVQDYSKWRKIYDAFRDEQQEGGVVDEVVYQTAGEPNDVTVTHEFATLEQAQAFVNHPQLKEAMAEAGVVGAPSIWFANKA